MILTCPQCLTRYQADDAKFLPSGRNVRCAKCSHVWHQAPPQPEPLPESAFEPVEEDPQYSPPTPQPAEQPSAYVAPSNAPAAERARIPESHETVPARAARPSRWASHIAQFAGWAALVIIVLTVGWSVITFRQAIATAWPQSASFYKLLGLDVNARGIAIVDAVPQRMTENGEPVLAITGKLVNISAHELPTPQIRVALLDSDRREVYHWLVNAPVMTLKPGQAASFKTRLASPPSEAHDLQFTLVTQGE